MIDSKEFSRLKHSRGKGTNSRLYKRIPIWKSDRNPKLEEWNVILRDELCEEFYENKYSNNQYWLKIPELIEKNKPSLIRTYTKSHKSDAFHTIGEETKVYGYFDENISLIIDKLFLLKTNILKKSNKITQETMLTINLYIRDRFYKNMMNKKNKFIKNLDIVSKENVIPPEMKDKRLNISFSSSTSRRTTHTNLAHASYMKRNNCWIPATSNDQRDFLIINLKGLCHVSGIGTKGRFPLIDKKKETVHSLNTPEWIKRYKLFYRTVDQNTWILVDHFNGNSDENIEVAHKLIDQGGSESILATHLRIQPTGNKCYQGYKSMRIAVYGYKLDIDKTSEEIKKQNNKLFDIDYPAIIITVNKEPSQKEVFTTDNNVYYCCSVPYNKKTKLTRGVRCTFPNVYKRLDTRVSAKNEACHFIKATNISYKDDYYDYI